MESPAENLSSFTDPNGKLFEINGSFVRAIFKKRAAFYLELSHLEVIQKFQNNGDLISCEIISSPFSGVEEDFGLFIKHPRLIPLLYPYEWSSGMLKDAALLTLDFNLELSKKGMMLQDASPWNIVYKGPKPQLVDYTSIVEGSNSLVWPAYDQFCRLFLFPLMLYSGNRRSIARSLLQNPFRGVGDEEFSQALALRKKISWIYWKRVGMVRLISKLSNPLKTEAKIKDYINSKKGKWDLSGPRGRISKNLYRDIQNLSVAVGSTNWGGYHREMENSKGELFDKKKKVLLGWVKSRSPATVVDFGCNQGDFSFLCADAGAKVLAVDFDEGCVEEVYQKAKRSYPGVTPCLQDLANPLGTSGWCGVEFKPFVKRCRSEMVLALALIHHLIFTHNHSFARVFGLLEAVAEKWLVVEFIPKSDARVQLLLSRKEDIYEWYTRGNFVTALEKHFKIESVVELEKGGRELYLCNRA